MIYIYANRYTPYYNSTIEYNINCNFFFHLGMTIKPIQENEGKKTNSLIDTDWYSLVV